MKRLLSLILVLFVWASVAWGQRIPGLVTPQHLDSTNLPVDALCLTYQVSTNQFKWLTCAAGGSGDNITVNASAAVDPNFADGDIDWTLTGGVTITATVGCTDCVALTTETSGNYAAGDAEAGNATGVACTDCVALTTETSGNYVASHATGLGLAGGAAGSEGATLTTSIDYTQTLAGNPALGVGETLFSDDCTSGGFLTEGSTANTNEQLHCFVASDGADTTREITENDAIQTLTGKTLAAADNVIDADTAVALAANPTDCAANQFATTIAASGNLTCAAIVDADVPNTITIDLAATATALAANPTDCAANQFATTIAASGNLTCAAIVDADVPDTITVTDLTCTDCIGATEIVDGSTTVAGVAEAAIASEVDTGTDAARYVSPDALAGSTIFGRKTVEVAPFDFTTAVATGDGKYYLTIPQTVNGMNLVAINAHVITVSSSGAVNVDIARCATVATGNSCSGTVVDVLSTNLTIDANESKSATAATAAVIDAANDDVATDQVYRIDVDGAGTGTQGLLVRLEFQLP